MRKIWFAVAAFVAMSGLCSAWELTCKECMDMCCEWAYSAGGGAYEARIRQNSTEPAPCLEETAKYGERAGKTLRCKSRAYGRCLSEQCSKCALNRPFVGASFIPGFVFYKMLLGAPGHYGVSGRPPRRFKLGQVIEVNQEGKEKIQ